MELRGATALVTGGNGGLGTGSPRAGEGRRACRGHVRPEPGPGGGRRPRAGIELSGQRRGVRLRHHRRRCSREGGRRGDAAFRRSRHPRQRRRLQQGDPVRRSRQSNDRGVGQDHRGQPDRAYAPDQGGGSRHEGAGTRPRRQHLVGVGDRADRLVDRLCGVEGGADPPDALHGGGHGARDIGQLRGAGPARGHPCHRQSPPWQIENSAATSLLKKPADKDDCADMVVAMCRTDTMTGQTVVINSGRYFH